MVLSAGCGGEPPATPAQPPPAEVVALNVRVEHGQSAFCPALEVGLARSGITVATDRGQPTDLVLSCTVSEAPDDGVLRITENGETRMRLTVRVQVRSPRAAAVDQFLVEYSGFRSRPDEEAVAKLVSAFAYSRRIAAYARELRAAPAATTSAVDVESATKVPPAKNPQDDATWYGIDTTVCKVPARLDACTSVRAYLQRFPTGAHASDATAVLTAAEPALEKLRRDDNTWQKAHAAECRTRRTTEACVGVEAYDIQYPAGLHSDEAKSLLRTVSH